MLAALPACAARSPQPVVATGPCETSRICVTADIRDGLAQPLEGVAVILARTSCYALTDSAGHARLSCDADRADGVQVRRVGYQPWTVTRPFTRGQSYAVRVVLQPVPPRIRSGASAAPPDSVRSR